MVAEMFIIKWIIIFLDSIVSQLSGSGLPIDVDFLFGRLLKRGAYTMLMMIKTNAKTVMRAAIDRRLRSTSICLVHHPAFPTAS